MLNTLPWEESENGTYTGGYPVDGVITRLPLGTTERMTANLDPCPHVTLNIDTALKLGVPAVLCDHVAAGRLVARRGTQLK